MHRPLRLAFFSRTFEIESISFVDIEMHRSLVCSSHVIAFTPKLCVRTHYTPLDTWSVSDCLFSFYNDTVAFTYKYPAHNKRKLSVSLAFIYSFFSLTIVESAILLEDSLPDSVKMDHVQKQTCKLSLNLFNFIEAACLMLILFIYYSF